MARASASEPQTQERLLAYWKDGYDHPGRVRVISKKDAAALGAEIEEDLVWDSTNGHSIDVTDMPETLVAYLKDADEGFKVSKKTVEVSEEPTA